MKERWDQIFCWDKTKGEASDKRSRTLFTRIYNSWQCNSILSFYINPPLPKDSSKISLRNTGQNILKRKLVVFTEGNKDSCVTDSSLWVFKSQSSFTVPPLNVLTPLSTLPLILPLKCIHKRPSQEVILVFYDANLTTFLTSKPLKYFEILKPLRQHGQIKGWNFNNTKFLLLFQELSDWVWKYKLTYFNLNNTFLKAIYKLSIGFKLQNNGIKQNLSIPLISCRYNVQSIHKRNSRIYKKGSWERLSGPKQN